MKKTAVREGVDELSGESSIAYRDSQFMDGGEGRPVRILAEYLRPLSAFARAGVTDTIVFFGSARIREDGPLSQYYDAARDLAARVTRWSMSLDGAQSRLIVCSGGGSGIMEAANRGAYDVGGRTIGLNIGLPHEQRPNAYLDANLSFEFHYFFMRKLWFAHLARAMVVFPGGFGTLDELFEILTLSQTRKLERQICVVLYGSKYWKEIINFEALVSHGVVSRPDLQLFHFADTPEEAFACLQRNVEVGSGTGCPAIAHSVTTRCSP